jgi:hypothetical protein
MFRKHLSYANVIASVALFIALSGSAVAAATLNRDSVGAPQIRKDAVRSPEIQKDSVRSEEIRDEDIKVGDIAATAETALRSIVEVAEDNDDVFVQQCNGFDLTACPNLLALRLNTHDDKGTARRTSPGGRSVEPETGRNWLVQAKLTIDSVVAGPTTDRSRCGLVLDNSSAPDTLLDEARHNLNRNEDFGESEAIALTTVFDDDRSKNPRIALRCTEQSNEEDLAAQDQKITALEVGKVIGP